MSSDKNPTRTRILKAAWDMLEENPGVAARMSDIAKKAGVSRQALYLHFPNRTELFIATTKYMDDVFCVQDKLDESRNAPSGRARLDAYVETWVNYIPNIFGIAKTLMVMAETDEDANRAWSERMQDMREGCAAAISALAMDGALKGGWSEKTATDALWALLSITHWELLTRHCGWSQDAVATYFKQTARTLFTK